MYIDGILKICGHDMEAAARVLDAINAIAGDSVKVIVTFSTDLEKVPESVKKYL